MRRSGDLPSGGYGDLDIELRHARIVATIDSAGSISKGASELNLPQPSLTAQLRRIERAVGGDLFIRSRAGVTRTALGERLIPMLSDLVKRADEVMAAAAAPTSGPLRFGNMEWTPPTLRGALQSALPAVELQTVTMDPATAVEGVQSGTLTAALVPSITVAEAAEGPEPALGKMLIVREPVWLALPLQHPLAGRHILEPGELATLGWVRYSQDHWFHAIERQLFAAFDHPDLEVLHRVDGHREAMNWVRDLGVAALTPPTGATTDVRLVPLTGPERVEMLLVWRSGAVPRETLRKLVDTVRQYYGEYARTVPGYWHWIVEHPRDFLELNGFTPPVVPS
ncbi:LysR family transcriptional regulator [Streptomyces lasiicapitis]|uniref:LysR family transcriptional regulator n=1 Tax=Streptomyces lasiicapitis TaxID=1923961 RepID=UPI001E529ED0|nr:LysR family transcriptional regulator [Streptomyces lasiicapitis]